MTEINDPLAWVARDDPDLKGEEYIGEFVISQAVIYLVSTAGQVREVGVDILQSLITITQHFDDGLLWQINYGPKDYLNQRGGDLMIEVGGDDIKIKQVLRGQ